MTLKDTLLNHLLRKAEGDGDFARCFDPKKLASCVEYVTQEAKKHLQGKNGAIEDVFLFCWAEEFFCQPRKKADSTGQLEFSFMNDNTQEK